MSTRNNCEQARYEPRTIVVMGIIYIDSSSMLSKVARGVESSSSHQTAKSIL
jgi:hypothetical protein